MNVRVTKVSRLLGLMAMSTAAVALTGCAVTPQLRALGHQQKQMRENAHHPPAPVFGMKPGNYVAATPVKFTQADADVTLHVNGVPLQQALHAALPSGWTLSVAGGIDPTTPVSVNLLNMPRQHALRQIALAGGGVIVSDPKHQHIVVARQATYYYVVPAGLLGQSRASLQVSSSTSLGQGGSSGGGIGGGGIGGSSMGGGRAAPGSMPGGGSGGGVGGGSNGASFQVSGTSAKSGFEDALKKLVGQSGTVTVDPTTGQVSITAGSGGLMRADAYIRHYVSTTSTQVEIHAAILEVQLNESLATGIQWDKLLSKSLGSIALAAAAPSMASVVSSGGNSASFQVTHTGASLNSVITALQGVGNVRVLTQPWLSTSDGAPATINSGTQVPYVGTIENNVSGLSGTTTTGAGLSYATNGVALSFVPQVLSPTAVQMTIIPSLSTIQSFSKFQVNGQTLEGPILQQRQAFVRLMAKPDQTIILGGSITRKARTETNGIPWLSRLPVLGALFGNYGEAHSRNQLVILVRTHVTHAEGIDPLIGESL